MAKSGRWIAMAMVSTLVGLAGCAARAPKGAEVVHPAWNGKIDTSGRLGVYLALKPGVYSQADFEIMSRAEEVMKLMRPGLKWAWIDSSHPGTANLKGWDLDALARSIRSDPALKDRVGSGMERSAAPLQTGTRTALGRVGEAYGVDVLVAIRSDGVRAAKDSSKLFQDRAWIGVFDTKKQEAIYMLQASSEGKQSTQASAESDWAKSVWEEFRLAIANLPERLGK